MQYRTALPGVLKRAWTLGLVSLLMARPGGRGPEPLHYRLGRNGASTLYFHLTSGTERDRQIER